MVKVKYDDLSAAFDFVSFGAPFEHRAFISRETGAVHWVSEAYPIEEEDLPDDLETSDRYIAGPHKNDLDLGSRRPQRDADEELMRAARRPGILDDIADDFVQCDLQLNQRPGGNLQLRGEAIDGVAELSDLGQRVVDRQLNRPRLR